MAEVGTAIKFLSVFPPADELASRAAYSLCKILGSSTHLTPGPALKGRLKQSYYRSAAPYRLQEGADQSATPASGGGPNSQHTDWTQANFLGAWEWVQRGTVERVREWGGVGVAVDDVMELVERARQGGNKLNRFVYLLDALCSTVTPHPRFWPGLDMGTVL